MQNLADRDKKMEIRTESWELKEKIQRRCRLKNRFPRHVDGIVLLSSGFSFVVRKSDAG